MNNTVLKVLGLTWRTEQGDFIFDLRNLMDFLKDKKKTQKEACYKLLHVSFSENLGTWS